VRHARDAPDQILRGKVARGQDKLEAESTSFTLIHIFYPNAPWFHHVTGHTPSPLYHPITVALDTALIAAPGRSLTGFWASPKWSWPGRGPDWTQCLRDREAQEYFSLPHPGRELPSRELMFEEWASDFTFPADDYHRSRAALADEPSATLHPWTQGVMSVDSRKLQSTAFQVITGHAFSADYSHRFRPSSDDRMDCPRCGDLHTIKHVLDVCPSLAQSRQDIFGDFNSHTLFSTDVGGLKLTTFLHYTQRLLHPLDPLPPDIPPELDP
jgi:hypothetical protein